MNKSDDDRRWQLTGMIWATEDSVEYWNGREQSLREIAAQRTAIGIPTAYEDLFHVIEGPAREFRGTYPRYLVKHEGPNRRARRDMKFGRPNEFGWKEKDY